RAGTTADPHEDDARTGTWTDRDGRRATAPGRDEFPGASETQAARPLANDSRTTDPRGRRGPATADTDTTPGRDEDTSEADVRGATTRSRDVRQDEARTAAAASRRGVRRDDDRAADQDDAPAADLRDDRDGRQENVLEAGGRG